MVKTMDVPVSSNSSTTQISSTIGSYENGRSSPDDLMSDFSIISHPSNDPEQLPPLRGTNLDHLNHLQFSVVNPMSLETQQFTSTEEVQEQLRDIVKENVELKEALQQNNVTLRQHFATITNWQEQYQKARQRQKEVVESMRDFTEALQEDKTKLLAEVQAKEEFIEELSKEMEKAQLEMQTKEKLVNKSAQEIDTLKQELERQQVGVMHLEETIRELQTDIISLGNQKATIESELRKEKMPKPTEVLQSLGNDFLVTEEDMDYAVVHHGPSSFANDELALLRQTIEAMKEEKSLFARLLAEEQTESKKLRTDLQTKIDEVKEYQTRDKISSSLIPALEGVAVPPDDLISVAEGEAIHQSLTSIQDANAQFMKYQDRFTSLNDQLHECQERLKASMQGEVTVPPDVEKLWDEVCVLRTIVKEEQETKELYRQQLHDSQQKFQTEYQNLVKKWEAYQSDVKTQGKQLEAMSEIEKRKNQEQLDELMAKFLYLEESLQEKQREVERMQNQIQRLEREAEQIPILRSQNELFQIDIQKAQDDVTRRDSLIDSQKKEIYSLQTEVVQLRDVENQVFQQQLAEMSSAQNTTRSKSHEKKTKGDHHRRRESLDATSLSSKSQKCPIHRTPKSSFDHSGEAQGASGIQEAPRSSPSSLLDEQDQSKMMKQCPRCFLSFKSYSALQNHVESCFFENDDNPFL